MSLAETYCLIFFSDFLNQEYHEMYIPSFSETAAKGVCL